MITDVLPPFYGLQCSYTYLLTYSLIHLLTYSMANRVTKPTKTTQRSTQPKANQSHQSHHVNSELTDKQTESVTTEPVVSQQHTFLFSFGKISCRNLFNTWWSRTA